MSRPTSVTDHAKVAGLAVLPLVAMVVGREGRLARRHLGHDPRRHDRRPAHGAGRARHRDRLPRQPDRELRRRRPRPDPGDPRAAALLVGRLEHLPRDRDRAARRRSCSASSSSSCSCAGSSARPGSSSPSRRSASPRSWSRSGSCCRSGSATATSCSTRRSSTCTSRSGSGLNSTNFFGNDVLTLIVVPDRAARARRCSSASRRSASRCAPSAENADRASLLGIPVRRLQSVVWGLAGFLAFVAMFLRIGVDGSQLGQVLDPTLLLMALGAAVIGRMERLPTDHVLGDRPRHRLAGRALPLLVGRVPVGDHRRDHRGGAAVAAVHEPLPAHERGDLHVAGDPRGPPDPGRAARRARGPRSPAGSSARCSSRSARR